VDEFTDHVSAVRMRSGWDDSLCRTRISRVLPTGDGFALDDEGVFPHILIAPGHPGLFVPPELVDDPRVVHAYEPHDYAESVAIGVAVRPAGPDCWTALAEGASVVAVRPPDPFRRPPNAPRQFFSRRGLNGFHATPHEERTLLLRRLAAASYPPGRAWDAPV